MLRRLLRGRDPLNDPDPAKRRAAVLALSDADAARRGNWLTEHLRSDPDAGVRRACLEKVVDASALNGILDDTDLGDAAVRRFIELTPDARTDEPPRVQDARILTLPAEEAAALAQAIDDPERLAALALRARGKVRDALLELPPLWSTAGLTALEKASRDHDKKLNRHARKRLEALKKLRQDADAAYTRAEDLAQALLRSPAGADRRTEQERRTALYRQFLEQLARYEALREALQPHGEGLPDSAGLRSRIPEVMPQPEAPAEAAEPAFAPAAKGPPGAEDAFQALAEGLQQLDAALADPADFQALRDWRDQLTESWLKLADRHPATASQRALFERVSSRYRALDNAMTHLEAGHQPLPAPGAAAHDSGAAQPVPEDPQDLEQRAEDLDRLIRRVGWPDWAAQPPAYRELLAARTGLEQAARAARQKLQGGLEALDRQLDALAVAIDSGSLSEAQPCLVEARRMLDGLPTGPAASHHKRLNRLAARLTELKDWQTFATSPKREALRDAMLTLADEPLEPRRQAERIKSLRAEWRALGPITNQADRKLADEFNEHAERAFKPCRTFFAAEAEQRARNLEERRRICQQLETYLGETDWRQADIRAAEKILHAARREWRSFHPVERTQGNELAARFETLQAELHGHVRDAWERNLAEKEAIVAEAAGLCDDGHLQADAVASVKALQRRWTAVGPTPRKRDQALWEQFRAACDEVFSALDAQRTARQAEDDERTASCQQALNAFAAKLDTTTADSAETAVLRRFEGLRREIGSLPASSRPALLQRHEALTAAYQLLLQAQVRAALEQELDALRQADEAAEPAAGDEPVALETLRRLAVQAEVRAGIPSPAEDEPLRLQLQVDRLNAGFAGNDQPEDPLALAHAWCELGAKPRDASGLRDRFFTALLDSRS